MFRRVVCTECTQPCITITAGDPMDKSVVELSLPDTGSDVLINIIISVTVSYINLWDPLL